MLPNKRLIYNYMLCFTQTIFSGNITNDIVEMFKQFTVHGICNEDKLIKVLVLLKDSPIGFYIMMNLGVFQIIP